MKISDFFLFIILIILLVSSKVVWELNHTQIELFTTLSAHLEKCSPEIFVNIRKIGIENVVSSCLIQKKPFMANCTAEKLFTNTKLKPVCLNSTAEIRWLVTLYGKHTLFHIPKIELINETLK